ncbi:MAG TPA: regulatory protein RecX [bacterium]|nr:regulatory protein RecX [bacterium]
MKRSPLSYALLLLKIRERSSGELEQKMRMKKYADADISVVIKTLIEKELINDKRFAANLVREFQEIRLSGRRKIYQKLRERQVAPDLIEQNLVIDKESEETRALELANRWLKQKGSHKEKEKQYASLGRFLAGRGFDSEVVYEVLGEVFK